MNQVSALLSAEPLAAAPLVDLSGPRSAVLDTNIVLDLLVFQDPATVKLKAALAEGRLQWMATGAMRDELARVLGYSYIVKSLLHHTVSAAQVLAGFDAQVSLQAVAARASAVCKDPDDQKFIDLAVAHRTLLLSKDKAVLCMKKRLLALDVLAQMAI